LTIRSRFVSIGGTMSGFRRTEELLLT
jgi:hypothetical protein